MSDCEVSFVKLDPTGNTTLLVTSRHHVRDHPSIASQLLSPGHVHAEQVGFVLAPTMDRAHVRLQMAGHEFCGNACMALASIEASRRDPGRSGPTEIMVESSGAGSPVSCRVEHNSDDCRCEIAVPLPYQVAAFPAPRGVTGPSSIVRYRDATHVVLDGNRGDPELREHALDLAESLGRTEDVPVVGVMIHDPVSHRLDPLISIPSLRSMVWEASCASGTASLGACLATRSASSIDAFVQQPGGTLHVRAEYGDGRLESVHVAGSVRVVAEGTAYVHV